MIHETAAELLAGAGDVHVHTSPSLVPNRKSNLWELVQACEQREMAFAVVKWHHGDSVSAATVVNQAHDGPFKLFGGLVLNRPVGGLNPYAVDCAVTLGAKVIWLPTLDASGHGEAIGQLGGFPFQRVRRNRLPIRGLRILGDDGNLCSELKEILSLLDGTETVLASGHITTEEIIALADYLTQNRLDIHLLVNHAGFSVPHLSASEVAELAGPKIWFELAYFTVSPLGHSPIEAIINLIVSNPHAQFVLASDSGQAKNPIGPEAMITFISLLLENGLTEKQVSTMLHQHTRELIMLPK